MTKEYVGKVIKNDLKVFPWLKFFSFNESRLELIYLDTCHGDLWKRYTEMEGFGLLYIGRLTEYKELIKEKADNGKK